MHEASGHRRTETTRRLDDRAFRRAVRASLIVGTVLVALNQGDRLLAGDWSASLWWKVPLTYVVPFLVTLYGAMGASRHGED